ncbi:MAG: ABC transporter permease, partial [Gammaproteobacteria bacterium]|nr:ABC transporter permease [Gammaproteobacteria bacterium]
MLNLPLTRKIFRDLRLRIGTLIAVACVLSVGTSSYVGMAGVFQNLKNSKDHYYLQYNLADFVIDFKRAPETTIASLPKLKNVTSLRSRIKIDAMVTLPKKSYTNFSHPIPGEFFSLPVPRHNIINGILLNCGTWFSNPYAHEVILNQQFATARNLHPGDRIKIRFPDKEE